MNLLHFIGVGGRLGITVCTIVIKDISRFYLSWQCMPRLNVVWHALLRFSPLALCHLVLLAPLLFAPSIIIAKPCKEDDSGSLTCDKLSDPGLSSSSVGTFRHVGNPVDVITGQKQQREIEFQAAGSPLHFSRYYHSAQTDANVALGQGWRHSYSIKLYAVGDQSLRITQADGRWIEFARIDSEDSSNVFMANTVDDGYIVQNDRSTWHLPNGKSVQFSGSFPAYITYASGVQLTLYYQNNRLESVSDNQGRKLKFEYHESSAELPKYQQSLSVSHAGHLRAVVLPSNERIRYEYDTKKNLTSAKYEDNSSRTYGYVDSVYPHHVTSISTPLSDRSNTRTWQYNDAGKVVRYASGKPEKSMSLHYAKRTGAPGNGETLVSYSKGRQERYIWNKSGADQAAAIVEVLAKDCESCKQLRFLPTAIQQQTSATVLEQLKQASNLRRPKAQTNTASTTPVMASTDTPTADALKPVPNSLNQQLQLTLDGVLYQFTVEMTRLGEVADISVGHTSLDQLKHKWRDGKIEVCDAEPLLRRSAINPKPEMACLEDLMYLISLADQIEDLSSSNESLPSTSGARSGFSVPPPDPECLENPFESCAELERNFELAQLSGCAYLDAITQCGDNWQAVSPESIGLSSDLFDSDSFSATLYYNPQTNEYVLAFRGTDDIGDWKDNFKQASGKSTAQYRDAVELALALEQALPGEKISFTGHSLGGGLATAAALTIGAEASVFNPASLHPDTAAELGLNIADADHLVDVTTVDGDLLTAIQEPKPGQWIERHEAPGDHTVIGAPDEQWIEDQKQNYPWVVRNDGVVLHSIDAVLETEAHLLEELCGTTPSRA